ncbi:hypothetical protein FHL15_007385 [Xylaria flabelliformis]|uniref:Uncharacterized protein n=1 Tax=Xylaria flabelliformis TaxID=2512241 RepID=A0A553HV63_9PEZI|nr:hypothetical protein FHL15_007385 [Xylaria flabelliformis]
MQQQDDSYGREPIAIIGMGCRLPGGVKNPSDFWTLLMDEKIASSSRVPKSRFNIKSYLQPGNQRPGGFNVPGGYFLDDDPEAFDPSVFKLSPAEALWMDPQQRKLLEVVYEAFESSGTPLEDVSGRKIGVFVGCFSQDFQGLVNLDPDFRHPYIASGSDAGVVATRISYVFNLRGPSAMINNACSSSLYAVDMACQSILAGQCEGAIVGGVNLILGVDQHMNTARMGVLSPTNQCHSFCDMADGYGRADGVGAFFVKRLSAAIRDGDPIRAVIRSTATGSNGRSGDGLNHPSAAGQVETMLSAYRAANLSPRDTMYVECHGTGTQVGDPIEARAIASAMCTTGISARDGDLPHDVDEPARTLYIGSVKPNIGHSEAASSMATLMKAVLALENGVIPPTTGIQKLNSSIPWDQLSLKVATQPLSIPASSSGGAQRIGINAFGYAGTNAHCIVESMPSVSRSYQSLLSKLMRPSSTPSSYEMTSMNGVVGHHHHDHHSSGRHHMLLFSAHNEATLKNILQDHSNLDLDPRRHDAHILPSLALTLATGRTRHPHRAFAITRDLSTFKTDIKNAHIESSAAVVSVAEQRGFPAFVFTGQGAQWARMGATLMSTYPVFLQTIRNLDVYLSKLPRAPKWTIESALGEAEPRSRVHEPELSQTLCTAVQIALVDLLSLWGIKPAACIGHSSGEISAAYAAGLVSSETAITAAYYRGLAVGSSQTDGAMLAVGLGSAESSERLNKMIPADHVVGRATIACYNSPASTTISGDRDCIESLLKDFQTDTPKTFARILRTGGKAYHSHHMKQFGSLYQDLMRDAPAPDTDTDTTVPATTTTCRVPMYSTVDNCIIETTSQLAESYWVRNLTSPVRFLQGMRRMLSDMPELNVMIEIGPHPALSGPLRQIMQEEQKPNNIKILSTLQREKHDVREMLQLAGHLWMNNVPLDMRCVIDTPNNIISSTPLNGCSSSSETTARSESPSALLLVDAPSYHWTYPKKLDTNNRFIRDARQAREPRHDILGRRLRGTSPLEPIWRNVLRLKDLPWVAEHRIGGEVLFPGAAYIACALEAMTQLDCFVNDNDDDDDSPLLDIESYTVRDFVISAATVVPDDDVGTETLFRLTPQNTNNKLSINGVTSAWYEFRMSCLSLGVWTETCRGRIALNIKRQHDARKSNNLPSKRFREDDTLFYSMPHIKMLNQLRETGLDLGPSFQHISTLHVSPTAPAARGDMSISTACGLMEGESRYLLHPTVIDSLFQPVQITPHLGRLQDLRCGYVPTGIRDMTFYVPILEEQLLANSASASPSSSSRLSFENTRIGNRATLSDALLQDSKGDVLVEISDIRCLLYQAAVPQSMLGTPKKDLYLQTAWDIDADYLGLAIRHCLSRVPDVSSVVDVLVYKDASRKVLALEVETQNSLLRKKPHLGEVVTLAQQDALYRLRDDGSSNTNGNGSTEPVETFDMIVSSKHLLLAGAGQESLCQIRRLLSSTGYLIFPIGTSPQEARDDELDTRLKKAGFSGIDHLLADGFIVTTTNASTPADAATATSPLLNGNEKHVKSLRLLLPPGVASPSSSSSSLPSSLSSSLEQQGWTVSTQMLSDNNNNNNTQATTTSGQVIILDAGTSSILDNLEEETLKGLINLIQGGGGGALASTVIWVTRGGLLRGHGPSFAMPGGLLRVLRRESESTDLVAIDFDGTEVSEKNLIDLVCAVAERQRRNGWSGETEYVVDRGAIYVSRLLPHRQLNAAWVSGSGEVVVVEGSNARDAAADGDAPAAVRGSLVHGQVTYYQEDGRRSLSDSDSALSLLEPDMVEVQVSAMGLSPPDGADDATFLSHEFAGTVVRVGSGVGSHLAPGTKVCGLALDNMATFQRASSRLVQPLPDDFSLVDAATIPSAFAAAMYALETLSRVEPGHVVALVDNMGSVTMAAAQVCHVLGACPIIVSTSETTVRVAEQQDLVPRHRIVVVAGGGGDDLSSVQMQLEQATGGKGIDVILCAAAAAAAADADGDDDNTTMLVECIQHLNLPGAQMVMLGQQTSSQAQTLNNNILPILGGMAAAGFSTHHLDLCHLIERRPESIARTLKHCVNLYKDGKLKPLHPRLVKGPTGATQLLRSLPKDMGSGKHILSYDDDETFFQVIAGPKRPLLFRQDATYLLVGGLGGLGRRIALWMAQRGARHLAFLSRSDSKTLIPEATETIKTLRNDYGVEVLVLSADISNPTALSRAIGETNPLYPIRGVLNAAAGFEDAMFHNMTIDMWRRVVNTKVKGSWNLHELFSRQDEHKLDFFVLTSSVSTTWGSAGQGNYAAANAFLDSLACHRRSRGLPAVSIILPPIYGIGHIASHPELVAAMQAKGLQGIYEDEMLEAFEVSMSPHHLLPADLSHFVVGLSPRALARSVDVSAVTFVGERERRFSWMVDALNREMAALRKSGPDGGAGGEETGHNNRQGQQQLTLSTIREASDDDGVVVVTKLLSTHLATKLGRLLMINTDDIDTDKNSVASLGLDSMFGAEFRNWIFREFNIDMPFQQLLSSKTTISELARGILVLIRARSHIQTLLGEAHAKVSALWGKRGMGDSSFGCQNLQSWRLPYQHFNIYTQDAFVKSDLVLHRPYDVTNNIGLVPAVRFAKGNATGKRQGVPIALQIMQNAATRPDKKAKEQESKSNAPFVTNQTHDDVNLTVTDVTDKGLTNEISSAYIPVTNLSAKDPLTIFPQFLLSKNLAADIRALKTEIGNATSAGKYSPLMPLHISKTLVENSFTDIIPQPQFITLETFNKLLDSQYVDDTTGPGDNAARWAVVNSVIALAGRFKTAAGSEADMSPITLGFYRNASLVIHQLILHKPSLLSIQALLSMAIFARGIPDLEAFIMLAKNAFNQLNILQRIRSIGNSLSPVSSEKEFAQVYRFASQLREEACRLML